MNCGKHSARAQSNFTKVSMGNANKISTAKCFLNSVILLTVFLVLTQQTNAQDSRLDLFEKTWTLAEMEEFKFSEDKPNLQFDRDQKSVSGSSGCNRFSSAFEISGPMMKFSPIISTRRACLDVDLQYVETRFLKLLERTTRFEVEGNTLVLYANDRPVLVFSDRARQEGSQDAHVTGTVSYRQRIALTRSAVIEVWLLDVSRDDDVSMIIAQQTIKPAGRQVPIAFDLAYDPRRINSRGTYSIQVRILERNNLRFISADAYPVITGGHPNKVNVIVKPVGK